MSAFLDGEWKKFTKEYTGDPDFLTIGNGESLTLAKYLGEKEEFIRPSPDTRLNTGPKSMFLAPAIKYRDCC